MLRVKKDVELKEFLKYGFKGPIDKDGDVSYVDLALEGEDWSADIYIDKGQITFDCYVDGNELYSTWATLTPFLDTIYKLVKDGLIEIVDDKEDKKKC